MAQGDLPEIFGSDWEPKETLDFIQPLLQSAAKREVMLFVAQKHDGRIALISDVWDHLISNEPKQFEGPSWHKFCTRFIHAVSKAIDATNNDKMANEKETEVIPRRNFDLYVGRRNQHFLLDMKLMLRRLAYYMSIPTSETVSYTHLTLPTKEEV